MYVAVKGGERAIEASWRLLDQARRGDTQVAELGIAQIRGQLRLAVARVMTEGSVYDEELAALAIKQAAGDLVEAIFLLRAYRTTLPRLGYTQPLDTETMQIERRISATFKDLPGGQVLGPTYDYTQRLLDFALLAEEGNDAGAANRADENGMTHKADEINAPDKADLAGITNETHKTDTADIATESTGTGQTNAVSAFAGPPPRQAQKQTQEQTPRSIPRVIALLDHEGLIEQETPAPDAPEPGDLSREPLSFPASRSTRLQNLARGDEGFLLSMGYATQRGYANSHPFAGEIRFGEVAVEMVLDELGYAVEIGDIALTECQIITQFAGSQHVAPSFTQGYGLAFGHSERKAMAMALVDRALRAEELGETVQSITQDVEFVLSHSDNVEASGFTQHLKLPHYVDFQAELELVRRLRAQHRTQRAANDDANRPVDDAANNTENRAENAGEIHVENCTEKHNEIRAENHAEDRGEIHAENCAEEHNEILAEDRGETRTENRAEVHTEVHTKVHAEDRTKIRAGIRSRVHSNNHDAETRTGTHDEIRNPVHREIPAENRAHDDPLERERAQPGQEQST